MFRDVHAARPPRSPNVGSDSLSATQPSWQQPGPALRAVQVPDSAHQVAGGRRSEPSEGLPETADAYDSDSDDSLKMLRLRPEEGKALIHFHLVVKAMQNLRGSTAPPL